MHLPPQYLRARLAVPAAGRSFLATASCRVARGFGFGRLAFDPLGYVSF